MTIDVDLIKAVTLRLLMLRKCLAFYYQDRSHRYREEDDRRERKDRDKRRPEEEKNPREERDR